jgi:hypothetical protein
MCPDTVGQPQSTEICVLQMPSLKAQELGETDAAIVAIPRGDRLANSICPLSAHKMRGAILSAERARKRSPHINGELVVGPEVFEQHADGIALQQQRTGHTAGYYIWVTENGYDLMCRAGGRQTTPAERLVHDTSAQTQKWYYRAVFKALGNSQSRSIAFALPFEMAMSNPFFSNILP